MMELFHLSDQLLQKISKRRKKYYEDNKDSLYTVDKAIEDIKYAFEELEFAEHKYDYNKLPKQN